MGAVPVSALSRVVVQISALGLAASFLLDLPTGATMLCMFGVSLAVAGLVYPFPRADQPLLDAAEYAAPSLRTIYFNATEAATYEDARRYAERYRAEAERLNEIETKSRSQGTALADDVVAKMSSFVRSYGEMRRGEEFVMREVRSRARERLRWIAAPVMLLLALLVAPGVLAFMRRKVERTRLAPGP